MTEFNPYQPPSQGSGGFPPFEPARSAPGQPLAWGVSEALTVGWDRVKHWWAVLIFAPLITGAITQTITFLFQLAQESASETESILLALTHTSLVLVLGAFFGVGLLRVFLTAVRGEEPKLKTVFTGGDRMWALLGTQILLGLVVTLGTFALIVPGIILGLGLSMAPYACVEQQLGPVESLKASWEMTKGSKWRLLGFGLVSVCVMFVGALALFVGMFVAAAVIYVGYAWIYLRCRGELVSERLEG